MHQVQIFAELHWAEKRPSLEFTLNEQDLITHCLLVDQSDQTERVIYSATVQNLLTHNCLTVTMNDARAQTVGERYDLWAEIVNIHIDHIPADELLYENSVFKHALDPEWLVQAQQHGFKIESEYTPGTQLRMNGTCFYRFDAPFFLHKVETLWKR